MRFLRAVTHRYPKLLGMLRKERADVYYARGAGYYTPFVVRAAKDVGARSVLALASDKDLYAASGKVLFGVPNARLSAIIGPLAHAGFRRWGLRAADWVAAQNSEQAAACEALGLRHAVLPSIVEPPPDELLATSATRDVIWVGHVLEGRRSKGLEALVVLSELLPTVDFTVVGKLSAESSRPALEDLKRLPNVELDGPLAHAETQRRIAEHRLVINTSPSEGFSNAMLEGWSLGRPSVTLAVNPSGLLTADRLGICAAWRRLHDGRGDMALLTRRARVPRWVVAAATTWRTSTRRRLSVRPLRTWPPARRSCSLELRLSHTSMPRGFVGCGGGSSERGFCRGFVTGRRRPSRRATVRNTVATSGDGRNLGCRAVVP